MVSLILTLTLTLFTLSLCGNYWAAVALSVCYNSGKASSWQQSLPKVSSFFYASWPLSPSSVRGLGLLQFQGPCRVSHLQSPISFVVRPKLTISKVQLEVGGLIWI
ncbi:hypothetical protein F5B21DRAFT_384888 [Xylaria acuta]|nr:hypothetical protein F5B21DRAFT_384888 [Xylaria acuta]